MISLYLHEVCTLNDGGVMCAFAAMIPVVGFNAVLMSEHFGAFFAFGVLHGALFIRYVKVCRRLSIHAAFC